MKLDWIELCGHSWIWILQTRFLHLWSCSIHCQCGCGDCSCGIKNGVGVGLNGHIEYTYDSSVFLKSKRWGKSHCIPLKIINRTYRSHTPRTQSKYKETKNSIEEIDWQDRHCRRHIVRRSWAGSNLLSPSSFERALAHVWMSSRATDRHSQIECNVFLNTPMNIVLLPLTEIISYRWIL